MRNDADPSALAMAGSSSQGAGSPSLAAVLLRSVVRCGKSKWRDGSVTGGDEKDDRVSIRILDHGRWMSQT